MFLITVIQLPLLHVRIDYIPKCYFVLIGMCIQQPPALCSHFCYLPYQCVNILKLPFVQKQARQFYSSAFFQTFATLSVSIDRGYFMRGGHRIHVFSCTKNYFTTINMRFAYCCFSFRKLVQYLKILKPSTSTLRRGGF